MPRWESLSERGDAHAGQLDELLNAHAWLLEGVVGLEGCPRGAARRSCGMPV